jgi:hypothetical protein
MITAQGLVLTWAAALGTLAQEHRLGRGLAGALPCLSAAPQLGLVPAHKLLSSPAITLDAETVAALTSCSTAYGSPSEPGMFYEARAALHMVALVAGAATLGTGCALALHWRWQSLDHHHGSRKGGSTLTNSTVSSHSNGGTMKQGSSPAGDMNGHPVGTHGMSLRSRGPRRQGPATTQQQPSGGSAVAAGDKPEKAGEEVRQPARQQGPVSLLLGFCSSAEVAGLVGAAGICALLLVDAAVWVLAVFLPGYAQGRSGDSCSMQDGQACDGQRGGAGVLQQRLLIVGYWGLLMVVALVAQSWLAGPSRPSQKQGRRNPGDSTVSSRVALPVVRKGYHILALLLFCPALVLDVSLLMVRVRREGPAEAEQSCAS